MFKRWIFVLACAAGLGFAVPSRPEVSLAVQANSGGVQSFYLGVSNYYHVPEREVIVVRERRIPDEEIPVVFFLASRARVAPGIIIEQRMSGMGWMDISLKLGLSPEVFYVPVAYDPGPPYGRAYGYYRHHPRSEWGRIRLVDADVVNMVNLRFMTEHYGYTPREVFTLRSQGRHFHEISAARGKDHALKGDGRKEKKAEMKSGSKRKGHKSK